MRTQHPRNPISPQQHRTSRRVRGIAALAVLAAGATVTTTLAADAVMAPGTRGNDVTFGADNDNADNPFIQPPGVTAKQHMDNTDVLFGRAGRDLLVGRLGGDTVVAGPGNDVLVGGPEAFAAPNSDVLLGEEGNDINIWAPGDGSDAFAGDKGHDTMVFAPFVLDGDDLTLRRHRGRQGPGGRHRRQRSVLAARSCRSRRREKLGAQFLVRFLVNGVPAVTVRQKDVEKVVCPSPREGRAKVARLAGPHPTFHEVHVNRLRGALGVITRGS